jgi:hypothetical protein
MTEPEKFAVAHQATSSSEAEIIRSILEGAGIFAVVPEQNSPLPGMDLTPFDGEYSFSDSQVLVPVSRLEEAKQIIAEARRGRDLPSDDDEDGASDYDVGPPEAGDGGAEGGEG